MKLRNMLRKCITRFIEFYANLANKRLEKTK